MSVCALNGILYAFSGQRADLYDSIRTLNARKVVSLDIFEEWQMIHLESMMSLIGRHLHVTPISDTEIIIFKRYEKKCSVYNVEQKTITPVAFPFEGKSFVPMVLSPIYKTKNGG